MADYEVWITTFGMWIYSVNKEQRGRAGFYALGEGDKGKCFHCGGGAVTDWKPSEDPWEQHAKWHPVYPAKAQKDSPQDESSQTPLQKEISTEEQLRRLQEEKLCKICMDINIAVIFIPCGHPVTHKQCAEAIDKCPMCHENRHHPMSSLSHVLPHFQHSKLHESRRHGSPELHVVTGTWQGTSE
ncbi:hypothetical protein H8959_000898 [Pygathrix nigripes]